MQQQESSPSRSSDRTEPAGRLETAQRLGAPIAATDADRALELSAGYAVQRARRELRAAAGQRVAGHKIGLTSGTARDAFGAAEPIGGYLFAGSVLDVPDGRDLEFSCAGRIEPKLEVEIAFILGAPLEGRVTPAEVLAATAKFALAFEIVESRWVGGASALGMLVADNSNAAAALLGRRTPARDVDVRGIATELRLGAGRWPGVATNVMGDPAAAVAWLATHLAERGERLEAGQIVLSGTLTAPVPVGPGDTAVADFGRLGRLTAHFGA